MPTTKADFLIEIGTEEIPPGVIDGALADLKQKLESELAAVGLHYRSLETFGTPCRLAALAEDLSRVTPPKEIRIQGPAAARAFDDSGKPGPAAVGFARKHGVEPGSLQVVETERGPYLCLVESRPGQPAGVALAEILPRIIRSIPFPRSMRWSDGGLTFARPIRWLAALHGSEIVPFQLDGLRSGPTSRGHKFLSPGEFKLTSATGYKAQLLQRKVMVDQTEREDVIRRRLNRGVPRGARLLEDDDLLHKVSRMVEWPGVYSGRFPEQFLELPDRVLITAMREHQHHFAVTDTSGRLTNSFLGVHNSNPRCVANIRSGNERVLRARLADARFFFQEDRKHPLADNLEKLHGVVFLQRLGTVYDRTRRLEQLAAALGRDLGLDGPTLQAAAGAARLAKCDLVSLMVSEKEFSHLQGYMGREYALASGEPSPVADAVCEHYLPRWAGDDLPATPAGALLAVCDKADLLVGCFGIGLIPSGSQDPYGLRRSVRGLYRIIADRDWDIDLSHLFAAAGRAFRQQFKTDFPPEKDPCWQRLIEFCRNRIEVHLMDQGYPYDVVRAVLDRAVESPRDAEPRAEAINNYRRRDDFLALAIGYRRVANIIRGYDGGDPPETSLFTEADEKRLFATLNRLAPPVGGHVRRRDFMAAMEKIVQLRPVIDSFFDNVLVMESDEKLRNNRFALLARVRSLFTMVADFSQIVVDK